jgi:HAD superfamily hydrolase (TIGR01509 family)
MPLEAVTFDFHNTLAECDEWFQIEIRDLVPRVLDWVAKRDATPIPPAAHEAAVTMYRELRAGIAVHGNERDAYDCATTIISQLGYGFDTALIQEAVDAIMREALPDSTPVEGVVEAVRDLRRRGIELAVISSAAHHDFIEWSLAKFDILDQFTHIVSSASCGYYKSRTDIYELTVERLGVAPEAAVHVGDSYRYDVQTAGKAGLRTVWFTRSSTERPDPGAHLEVTTLEGLSPLILDHFGDGR